MSSAALDVPRTRPAFGSLTKRRLDRYPTGAARYLQLGLAVAATIVLYYELYVQGSVATDITARYGMSFSYFVAVLVVGNACGAVASYAAGLADRWGRANLVVYGLLVNAALVLFALPNAGTKGAYLALFSVVSVVEGALLVATPALIRDFSPQLGRAMAMAFWTMGPVLGSLIVTEVASNSLHTNAITKLDTNWTSQFHIAGFVGAVVGVLCLGLMRELSPQLRDQLMVSMHDRALIEARAAGIDPDALTRNSWRQMLRARIVGPAFGISVFLLAYYILVAFFVVYAATVLGYEPKRANALANWYWISNAIALVVAGFASDKVRVRKPFMIVGGVVSACALGAFTMDVTKHASYYTLATLLSIIAAGGGIAYCAWMAAFTETVESINPAATATGLAVWGSIIRGVVTVAFLLLPTVVGAASPLVDFGQRAQGLQTRYAASVAVLSKVDGATAKALARDPNDASAQAMAVSEVAGTGITAADVGRAVRLQAQYKAELATLQKVDQATLARLFLNPDDAAAQVSALSQISGLSVADVSTVLTVQAQHPREIQTLQTVTVPHLLALQANQADPAAIQAAVTDLVTRLHVTAAAALQRLTALATVPQAQLTAVFTNGPAVATAAAALRAAAKVPSADLLFLQSSGPKIQAAASALQAASAKVPAADQAFLLAHGATLTQAQKDAPRQWQHWYWICLAGQVLFLLTVPLLGGRWSPRRAAEDVARHEAAVAAELAALAAAPAVQRDQVMRVPSDVDRTVPAPRTARGQSRRAHHADR
jgi:hypothetical protein